jgi:hypothetical protein
VNNYTSPRFWRHYHALPPAIQKLADKNFQLFKSNPQHPSLRFERKSRNYGQYGSATDIVRWPGSWMTI